MKEPKYPWDVMHHCCFFLPEKSFSPTKETSYNVSLVETKDFMPLGKVDWFKNLIPTPYVIEEGNISNISPTIKVYISTKLGKIEEIYLGETCSPKEIVAYKALLQEYMDNFEWSYSEMPGIIHLIMEHHINTWLDVHLVRKKQCPLNASKEEAI